MLAHFDNNFEFSFHADRDFATPVVAVFVVKVNKLKSWISKLRFWHDYSRHLLKNKIAK